MHALLTSALHGTYFYTIYLVPFITFNFGVRSSMDSV